MSTTSTIGLARAALVTALNTGALAGNVHYAWPGPLVSKGARELVWVDRVVPGSWTQEIAGIKAGRKQRQESYTHELVLWVAKPELTAADAQAAEDRALVLAAVVEDALANDVQLAQANIQWMVLTDRTLELVPFEKGWGCQIVLSIEGNARLT